MPCPLLDPYGARDHRTARALASFPHEQQRRRPRPGRAPHRLRLDGGDRTAARARARGAVPRSAVRGDQASASRERRGPAHRGAAGPRPAGGHGLHARRLRAARRDAPALPRARVHYCDLLGHPIDSISRSRASPRAWSREPRAARLLVLQAHRGDRVRRQVRRRVGSGLDEADVVLVGVSRTSKTPLSIYLGYLGHKAANVPVVRGIELPQELFEIDPTKIVGLTIAAERLLDIRTARVRSMGASRSAMRSSRSSTRSSTKRRPSTGASAARSSTCPSSRSRRRRCGSSARSRRGSGRLEFERRAEAARRSGRATSPTSVPSTAGRAWRPA